MIEMFDIADVNVSASTFNPEKLLWLNHHYIMESDPAHVAHHLSWHLGNLDIDPSTGPDLVELVKVQRERNKTLVDMALDSAYFYKDFEGYDEKAVKKHFRQGVDEVLQKLFEAFADIQDWRGDILHQAVIDVSEAMGLGMGKVAQPLRIAISGKAATPSIDHTLALLGREKTLERIQRAIGHARQIV
ncbi:MAG: glutamate--tRNA ligase, partial [Gammaproteobacteria bacterium]